MHPAVNALTGILIAVMGVAVIAVIFSSKAKTSDVLTSFGTAFSNILATALAPITGATPSPNTGGGSNYGIGSGNIGSGLIPLG
jgi:PRD1 phage membrane DNA delivery